MAKAPISLVFGGYDVVGDRDGRDEFSSRIVEIFRDKLVHGVFRLEDGLPGFLIDVQIIISILSLGKTTVTVRFLQLYYNYILFHISTQINKKWCRPDTIFICDLSFIDLLFTHFILS